MALFCSNKTIHIVYKNKKHQKIIMIFSLNFLCSFKTKAKPAWSEKAYKINDLFDDIISDEKSKLLKYIKYLKSISVPILIWADLESLFKKLSYVKIV